MTPEPVMADPLAWLVILVGLSVFFGSLIGYGVGRWHERWIRTGPRQRRLHAQIKRELQRRRKAKRQALRGGRWTR